MSTSNNTIFQFLVNHSGVFKLNPLTYEHGSILEINVPSMDFHEFKSYVSTKLTCMYRTTINIDSLYYVLPANDTLGGMKRIKSDYDINVVYDITKVAGRIETYISHHPIDLTMALVPEDGSMEASFPSIISEETKHKQQNNLLYLHQMHKRKQRYDYISNTFGSFRKSNTTITYTQTNFTFVVHNNGNLVIDNNRIVYINGGIMNITIPRMKLKQLKEYFISLLDKKIHAIYYEVPHIGNSSTVKLRNNYDMHVMYDIAASNYISGNMEIFIDHVGVSFSISKYICPNAHLAKKMQALITDYTSDTEETTKNSITQDDYTVDQMVEWAEQEHIENEDNKAAQRHKSLIWKNRMN